MTVTAASAGASAGALPGRRYSATMAAILTVALPAMALAADEPRAGAGPDGLVGRWSGAGFIKGTGFADLRTELTFEISGCAPGACVRRVLADGSCSDVLIEIEIGKPAATQVRNHATTWPGRLARPGQPPLQIEASLAWPAAKTRLYISEASRPIYSRRLPDVIAITLEPAGPATCAPRPTS